MRHLLVLAFLAALMGCGGKKIVMTENNQVKADGVMSLAVNWIKDKGKKVDFNFTLRNESESRAMIVYLHDLNCYRGKTMGELKHTFFGAGEKIIDFQVGQAKTFSLVCRLSGDTKGPVRLNVAKVYDNPSKDGRVPGKVIAANIDWKGVDPDADEKKSED